MARVQKIFSLPSRTKQSFKDECDINKIMKRFKNVSSVDFLSRYNTVMSGEFGDFSNVPDYRTAIERINAVDEVFSQLPAVVRKTFEHDPAAFLDFVQNPANAGKLAELGLTKAVVAETEKVEEGKTGT